MTEPTCEHCGQSIQAAAAAGFNLEEGTYYHLDCPSEGTNDD